MAKTKRFGKHIKMKIDDRKWRKIKKQISLLKGAVTAIGIHSDAVSSEGSSQALIAHVNEFGAVIEVTPKMRSYLHYIGLHLSPDTTTITIPERSFLRSWVDTHKKQTDKVIAQLYARVLAGKIGAKQALALLGAYAEGGIKKQITDVSEPPNHPITIKQKQSSNPLIDTGGMRNNIHHKEYFGGKKPK